MDCDPTLGRWLSDVDDVLALWFLHRRGVALAGCSSVFGNAGLDRTHPTLRAVGARLGVPVHRGAAGPGAARSDASEALRTFRGAVVALGPLTNVAAALDAGARWDRLIVLGGTDRRLPNLRPLHTTELNFALDPAAAARVLAETRVPGGVPVEVVPMEPCREVWLDSADLAGCPEWLRAGCSRWFATAPLRTGRFAIHPWDLLAAALLVEPSLFRVSRAGAILDPRPVRRGHVSYVDGAGVIVRGVDAPRLRRMWQDVAFVPRGGASGE